MASLPAPIEPRRKRIKIDVACDTCRSRKVKCDGVRPACGNCAKRLDLRDKCTYSGNNGAPSDGINPPQRRTSSFVSAEGPSPRRSIQSISTPYRDSQLPDSSGVFTTPNIQARPMRPDPTTRTLPALSPPKPSPGQSLPQVDTSPSVIDSMTTIVDQGFPTREYFGSSSAGSFTAQIKSAIDARLGEQSHGPPRSAKHLRPNLLSAGSGSHLDSSADYVLPPRRQADHGVSLYWFYVDPLYPFLDRGRWTQAYNGLFAGTPIDVDERLFIASLNLVLAISTQMMENLTPEQRDENSNTYFSRARDLLHLSVWDTGSVELVQCLLLMGQYLQSTNHPHQTWMIVGSAIRVAQGLGLHLPEASADLADADERELLRRLWHGCVLMDRIVSATHGRPVMISSAQAAAVPLPISSAEELAGVDSIMGNDLSHASFFVQSLNLYDIIHGSILAFYSGPELRTRPSNLNVRGSSDAEDEDLGTVLVLDRRLSRWKHNLPDFLQLDNPKALKNDISHRQSVILRIRFLHARILLLRPILARYCLSQSPSEANRCETDLQTRVMQQCALFCVETAQELISILLKYQTNDGTVGLLPAWWYRVYYVYSAATVLIAARLRPGVFPTPEVSKAWGQAMTVLRGHEMFGQSTRRCIAALHILSSKILQDVPAIHAASGTQNAPNHEGVIDPSIPINTQTGLDQAIAIDEFTVPTADFSQFDLEGISFDVNDFSWLNDVHAWELLNES